MKNFEKFPSLKYIADLRGVIEKENYRCFSTFNYKAYQEEHRLPFGMLHVVNDEYLAPGSSQEYSFDEDGVVLLIPILGAVDYQIADVIDFIHTNQLQILKIRRGDSLKISNPYSDYWVNFLKIHIQSSTLEHQKIDFELKPIFPIFSSNDLTVHIGIFDTKQEGEYILENKKKGIFVMPLNGAFEFENRLLENRDALCIWNFDKVAYESLPHQGILLVLEVNL